MKNTGGKLTKFHRVRRQLILPSVGQQSNTTSNRKSVTSFAHFEADFPLWFSFSTLLSWAVIKFNTSPRVSRWPSFRKSHHFLIHPVNWREAHQKAAGDVWKWADMIYMADVTSLWTVWWTGGTVKPTDASSESTKQLCVAHPTPLSLPLPAFFCFEDGKGGGGGPGKKGFLFCNSCFQRLKEFVCPDYVFLPLTSISTLALSGSGGGPRDLVFAQSIDGSFLIRGLVNKGGRLMSVCFLSLLCVFFPFLLLLLVGMRRWINTEKRNRPLVKKTLIHCLTLLQKIQRPLSRWWMITTHSSWNTFVWHRQCKEA